MAVLSRNWLELSYAMIDYNSSSISIPMLSDYTRVNEST
jgi:hypothetical protein